MSELSAIVETGPDPEVDGVVRWDVSWSKNAISASGPSPIQRASAAPQTGGAGHRGVQKNPRTLAAHIAALPKTKRVEIWFQDEARLGQKNGHARIWAKTGTRPRLPADQRYANAYLFGAICPMEAKGAALMLPLEVDMCVVGREEKITSDPAVPGGRASEYRRPGSREWAKVDNSRRGTISPIVPHSILCRSGYVCGWPGRENYK